MNIVYTKQAYALGQERNEGFFIVLYTINEKAAASWNSFIGYVAASEPASRRAAIKELKDEGWECVKVTITRKGLDV